MRHPSPWHAGRWGHVRHPQAPLLPFTNTALTPPLSHFRVFFAQRLYKDLTLTHAPLVPAIRDAHVGTHESWVMQDNDVVIL